MRLKLNFIFGIILVLAFSIEGQALKVQSNNQNISTSKMFDTFWEKWNKEIQEKDRGLNDPLGHWAGFDVDDSDWDTMELPNNWEDKGLPDFDGVVWFRKEVNLSDISEATVKLSAVDDVDSTYFNGFLVGSSPVWDKPRNYAVPRHIIKNGKNVITVRVQDNIRGGGIWGNPDLLKLDLGKNNSTSLAGEWKYKIGLDFKEMTTQPFIPDNPDYPAIYVWPDEVPGETEAKHLPVIQPVTAGNDIWLTDVTNPVLNVFKPQESVNNGAAVIVCPGGGYNILAIKNEGYEIAEWLNKLGFTAFVLQYRVPDKRAGALNDIQRAIRIVRSKADKLKFDPEKIGVIGFSAGGSLCARASTLFSNDSYTKIDDIDALSSRPNFTLLIYPAYLDKGENRSLTPELTIGSDTPPMFIFGTADDRVGNSSLVMTTALRDAKIPVELHFLPKGGHGYGLREGNIAGETWPVLAERWLEKIITD
jgi:acetyl esterase/lipase